MMRVRSQQPALGLILIPLAVWGGQAHALGLGAITLQSGLGRPLQAKIQVYGLAADDAGAACLKSRLLALDGTTISRPVAELAGSGANAVLSLRTVEGINEPAVNVSVEIGCTNTVKREYALLLDPVATTSPLASPAIAERAERRTSSRAGAAVPPAQAVLPPPAVDAADLPAAAKAPASVVRKPPAPSKPKPAPASKSVLMLSGGADAEIEQVRASIALRSATMLSEPRVETDPARLAAQRADQARVAALLRGEDPLAGAQAQLRDAQGKLLAVQKSAASAASQHAQEKAALTAAQDDMVPGTLAAALGALLLACVAVIGWLLWRRADDRRRQEQAFFAMAEMQEPSPLQPLHHETPPQPAAAVAGVAAVAGIAGVAPVFAAPATPTIETRTDPEPVDFAMPMDDFAPEPTPSVPPQSYEWPKEVAMQTVSTSPPQSLQLPESWLTIENQLEELHQQAPQAGASPLPPMPPMLPVTDDDAQAHAAEVAGMLLAAESWMAEHNPLRAAEVLRDYLDREDMRSPAPGLYLLSLYRTMENQEQILAVLAQLQRAFPAEAAGWGNAAQPRRSIADFPLVHSAVDSLSNSDELLPYLNSLLLAPEPFDFSTYREIVRAIGLANEMKQENDLNSMSFDFQ